MPITPKEEFAGAVPLASVTAAEDWGDFKPQPYYDAALRTFPEPAKQRLEQGIAEARAAGRAKWITPSLRYGMRPRTNLRARYRRFPNSFRNSATNLIVLDSSTIPAGVPSKEHLRACKP
jgi:hypothetical protein